MRQQRIPNQHTNGTAGCVWIKGYYC